LDHPQSLPASSTSRVARADLFTAAFNLKRAPHLQQGCWARVLAFAGAQLLPALLSKVSKYASLSDRYHLAFLYLSVAFRLEPTNTQTLEMLVEVCKKAELPSMVVACYEDRVISDALPSMKTTDESLDTTAVELCETANAVKLCLTQPVLLFYSLRASKRGLVTFALLKSLDA
jgi:hypothetical protein